MVLKWVFDINTGARRGRAHSAMVEAKRGADDVIGPAGEGECCRQKIHNSTISIATVS